MKKLLYGTTALATAGIVAGFAADASAAERLKLGLGGYHQQWVVFSNQDIDGLEPNNYNSVDQKHNSEVCFIGETTLDNDAGYKIKPGTIKASITISRATATTLMASVIAKGKRIPLVEYTARPVKPGVTVAVKEGRKLVRGVFFATMPTGHRGVYERDTRRGSKRVPYQRNGKRNTKQLPIRELYGPSIPQAFVNATVQDALLTGVRERFPVILARELAYVLFKTK